MVHVSLIRGLLGPVISRSSAGRFRGETLRKRAFALLAGAALAWVPSGGAQAAENANDPGPQANRMEIVPFQPQIRYPEGMAILFSGARHSKIEPCGCRGRNLGGIDKEATMMQAYRNATAGNLAVDAGGFFREFMDPNLKLQGWYVLEALKELKYDVVNIGYPDFRSGIDVLKKIEAELGLPFISANIVDSATKKPYFEPFKKLTVTMKDGKQVTVGVIGVTAPNHGTSNPPEQILPRKALPLEVPPTPMAGGHPTVRMGLPTTADPAATSWVIGSNIHEVLDIRGGSANPAPVAGGQSRALRFALDGTTPTLTRGMYEVMDEVQAIETLAKKLRMECDVMVLLAYAGPERSRKIAEQVPAFDVVVCGDGYQLYDPYFFGPTNNILWVAAEHEGRLLGKVEIAFEEDDNTIRDKAADIVPVDQNIPTVQALTDIINAYKRDTQKLPPPPGQKIAEKVYVGASRCASCHEQETVQWKSHKHSKAMKALIDKDMQFNPDCLRCHTVAYGQPGGFTDLRVTPFLANVQCETCHGPGKHHIDEERRIAAMAEAERVGAERKEKMKMEFDTQFCMQCHDPENDPHFDFSQDIHHVIHTSTQPNRTRVTTSPMMMGASAASVSSSH